MQKHPVKIIMGSFLFMASQSALNAATSDQHNWYLSPAVSYIKADNARDADNAAGFMLGVGKQLGENWNLELSAVIDSLEFASASGEYKQRGVMLDGLYFFDRNTVLQTYAIVGAGVMKTEAGASDSSNPMLNAGIGMMQQLTDSGVSLRAELRYRVDMDDSSVLTEDEFGDVLLNVGLNIPFGSGKSEKTGVNTGVARTNVPMDSDNDGVLDSEDMCPASAAGAKVDVKGCLQKQKTAERPPANELDSDNDGVVDSKDQCLDSVAGEPTDANGCKLEQSFVLKGVNFVTGSDTLTASAKSVLNEVAATLKKNAGLHVDLAGYTDDRGAAGFNQRLSLKRAESVKRYLESVGVAGSQLSAKGYGEEQPIADNETAAGRTENRRVELHILK